MLNETIYSFKFRLLTIDLSSLLAPTPFVRDILHGPAAQPLHARQTKKKIHQRRKLHCVCANTEHSCVAVVTRNKYNFQSENCQQENWTKWTIAQKKYIQLTVWMWVAASMENAFNELNIDSVLLFVFLTPIETTSNVAVCWHCCRLSLW